MPGKEFVAVKNTTYMGRGVTPGFVASNTPKHQKMFKDNPCWELRDKQVADMSATVGGSDELRKMLVSVMADKKALEEDNVALKEKMESLQKEMKDVTALLGVGKKVTGNQKNKRGESKSIV